MLNRASLRLARATVSAARPLAVTLPRLALRSPRPASIAHFSSSSIYRATATTPASSVMDPQTDAAQEALDKGTEALQQGDLPTAKKFYEQSLDIKESAIGHYNLGVVRYQSDDLASAITSFESSIRLTPSDVKAPEIPEDPSKPLPMLSPAQIMLADTHTNLGAAYILSTPPRPDKALEHLQQALMLSPEDGEVCYNLAAVLEATNEWDEALIAFQRAEKLGIERAATNIRNLGAKILGRIRKEEEEKKAAAGAA